MRSPFCYFCYFCGTISISCGKFFCPTVIGFAASLVEEIKEIKEILLPAQGAALSVISAISVGHYYLMRIVFYCPTQIKEIKEIFLLPRRSRFCYFCHFCGTISISCGKFFCPTEIKEILLPARCEALSAISALSAGLLVSHAESFFVPRK